MPYKPRAGCEFPTLVVLLTASRFCEEHTKDEANDTNAISGTQP